MMDLAPAELGDLSRLRRMGAASYRLVDEEINIEEMVAVFSRAVETALSLYSNAAATLGG